MATPHQKKHVTASPFASRLRGICFGSYYWLTGRGHMLRGIDRSEQLYRAPRAMLEMESRRRLCRLLSHAIATVPYYRDMAGPLRRDLSEDTAISVLGQMPVLTKDVIRCEHKRLVSEEPGKKVRWNTSGGSTGEPIRLMQDCHMRQELTTNQLLFLSWLGYRLGDLHLLVWGAPAVTFERGFGLHDLIYQRVHNQVYLNCYTISDDVMEIWLRFINTRQPVVIEGYADAMYALSRRILEEQLQMHRPRGIITSAGVLLPTMMDTISAAFGRCPVLNRYGSREVGDVACSCLASRSLHVSELLYHIEIVDENERECPPGVEGDILVTLLTNFTMPLIRYRIEDRGIWDEGLCSCGRTTRRIAAITGRQSDYLLAANGSRVNGTALTTLLYDVPGIRRFQYRQTHPDRVKLSVVPLDARSQEQLSKDLPVRVKRLAGLLRGSTVEVVFVDEIVPSASGKHRYIINEIASTTNPTAHHQHAR